MQLLRAEMYLPGSMRHSPPHSCKNLLMLKHRHC
uniref:Uncharacterized protein n=1 Tax=Arundo donax TaxID=35708 RepID=A0A0A9B788_ARUDO